MKRPLFRLPYTPPDQVDRYQDWSNSATWSFALMFTQEEKLLNQAKELIRENRPLAEFVSLFKKSNLLIEDWATGLVSIEEIVEDLKAQYAA